MSTAETEDEGFPLGEESGPEAGDVYTLRVLDTAEAASEQPSEADAKLYFMRDYAVVQETQPELVANTYGKIIDFTTAAWEDGTLPYADTGGFFNWLRYNLGVPVISLATVTGGALAGYLLKYDQEHGIHPAKEPTFKLAAPLGAPTHGQRTVADAAKKIVAQQITAPGLSPAAGKAISKAIGIASADLLKAQALGIDRMLPGMAPGQVPEALTQLDTAAGVLEKQLNALQKQVGTGSLGSISGKVSGATAAITALQAELAKVTAELELKAPSELDTHVNAIDKVVTEHTSEIDKINKELPKLATTAALTALTGKVDVAVEDLALKHASALDTALNGVEHSVTALQAKADDLDECCSANSDITNPIRAGGATPSLLHELGNLLKGAFGLSFLAGILDPIVAMFNLPAAFAATVDDVATISTWADGVATELITNGPWPAFASPK